MSRTYRRKKKGSTKNWNKYRGNRIGSPDALAKGLPPYYKNAKRMRCAASGSVKWWFHSKDAAIAAAKYNCQNRFENGKARKYERAYHCKSCDGWHLTTMDWEAWHDRKAELARLNGIELDEKGNFTELKPLDLYPDSSEGLM